MTQHRKTIGLGISLALIGIVTAVPGAASEIDGRKCDPLPALEFIQCVKQTVGNAADCVDEPFGWVGAWEFLVADAIRDPLVAGTYYIADWAGITYFGVDGETGECVTTAYTCTIHVEDSTFQYSLVRQPDGSYLGALTGDYHGLPVLGGAAGCSNTGASLDTGIAGIIHLTGHSVPLGS